MKDITPSKLVDKWPKKFPPLTAEQTEISNDFMNYWHKVLPVSYGMINKFNHSYAVKNAPSGFIKTLEIGCGDGEHLHYEKLTPIQKENYYAIDIRQNMIDSFRKKFPEIHSSVSDCQRQMIFEENFFDRIIAIHVLEHLPDLPAAIKEIHRLCDKKNGILSIVIPCEGSLAYTLARKISAERVFVKRYKQPYKWLIEREHINVPSEIFEELNRLFVIQSSTYFPIPLPFEFCNLCIGLTLTPRT